MIFDINSYTILPLYDCRKGKMIGSLQKDLPNPLTPQHWPDIGPPPSNIPPSPKMSVTWITSI